MSYAPYPAYKDSGVPWLGQVPEGWETGRIDFQCTVKARLGWKGLTASEYVDEGYVFLATPNIKGNEIDFEKVNYINEQRYLESPEIMIQPGDVLLAKDGSTLGTTNYVRSLPRPATVNSSIAIVRPRKNNIDGAFLYRWIEADLIQSKIQQMKDGQGVPHLFQSDIRKFPLPLPPIEEQTAIAGFLDKKTAEIDDLIAKKEELLRLLAEQRTALITHAVTKGLNPNATMKPSGIDWLGDVPEGWEVKRLKHLSIKIIDGAHFTPTYTDEGVPFLRVTDIVKSDGRDIDLGGVKFISEQEHRDLTRRCKPEKGDLLYSKNGTIGVPRTIDWDWEFSIFVSLCLIKLNGQVLPEYLEFALTSKLTENQISFGAKATSVTNLHLDKIKEFIVVTPPLAEQEAIVKWLKAKAADFTQAIERVEDGLEYLREYRTALITNAVTGKIKVA